MRIKIYYIFLVTLLSTCLIGCEFLSTGNTPIRFSDKEMALFYRAQSYIGSSSIDVENNFGKPEHIRKDVRRNDPDGKANYYDEAWYYRYSQGIPLLAPNIYGVTFYLQNGIVLDVSG